MTSYPRRQRDSRRSQKIVPRINRVPAGPQDQLSKRLKQVPHKQDQNEESQNTSQPQSHSDVFSQQTPPGLLSEFRTQIVKVCSNQDELYQDQRRHDDRQDGNGRCPWSYGEEMHSRDRERSRSPYRCRNHSSENNMFYSENLSSHIENDASRPASGAKSHPSKVDVGSLEKNECICQNSYACPSRRDNELDCRSLVAKWVPWSKSFDQRVIESASSWVPNPNAPVATVTEINEILDPPREIENLPATSVGTLQKTFNAWVDAILTMKKRNVSQGLLDETQAIENIQRWLNTLTRTKLRQKRIKSWFVEEMARFLRNWKRGDFYCDPNRGLKLDHRGQWKLDKDYVHYRSFDYYGQGDMINGDVWTSRLQMLRDGAHGATQAGISGCVVEGARSIVMGTQNSSKKDCYADIDCGRIIEYMGTARDGSAAEWATTNIQDPDMDTRPFDTSIEPTRCTQMLMRSLETRRPVRVFRSYKPAGKAPMYRFDGMYVVTRKTPRKEAQQIWSFTLERCPHQGKLRARSKSDKRNNKGPPRGWTWYKKGSKSSTT